MIFYGIIKELAFKPDNLRGWLQFLEQKDGHKVVMNIGDDKAKRSLDQNALMHLYIDVIARETGHDHEELHRIFKGLFLPKKKVTLNGVDYWLTGSTTELTKAEMREYLDKICALTNIPIPDTKLAHDVIAYPTESNKTLL